MIQKSNDFKIESKFALNVKNKINGVVYTPKHIVINMLDMLNYSNKHILNKHIIDNSCGEGAFLIEVLKRYIIAYYEEKRTLKGIVKSLEKYIHGIEIDKQAVDKTIINLNLVLKQFNIEEKIKWDIKNDNILNVNNYNNKIDYVVGNPPYIRIHNLCFEYKNYDFSSKGMTDMYIIFFEIGLKMLKPNGQLIYITPNSYFTSKAGSVLREYLFNNKIVKQILNLKHYNPFNVTTYTAITHISKKIHNKISYFEYDSNLLKGKKIADLPIENCYLNNQFYFSELKNLEKFRKIITIDDSNNDIEVKNGVATNLDSFFFSNDYQGWGTKKAYKISRSEFTNVIFPYDAEYNLISIDKIKEENKEQYNLFLKHKGTLAARNLQGQEWYAFARTQAIRDTHKKKIAISNIVRNIENLKIEIIDEEIIVYSGYYIISEKYSYDKIIECIRTPEFIEYLKIIGKDKNGNYYFFQLQI